MSKITEQKSRAIARKKVNKRAQGAIGENLAAEFLEKNGYLILQRNYRFERGEIDLIAKDENELVFVEVKARASDVFGSPEEAVTPEKQRQIRMVAEGYLFDHKIEDQACRFDVVAIHYVNGKPIIKLIRNAF